MKKKIIKSLLVGLIVFIFGFGAMYLFWIYGTYPHELPGLFSYYSSGIGDSIFLPVMSAGFAMFFLNSDYNLTKKQKVVTIVFGIIGALSGIALQVSWLINSDIGLNWTIPKPHCFNAAGWYHAAFLVLMFAFVAYSLAKWWIIMYNKNTHELKDVFVNSVIWGSGSGFLYTFAIDNLKGFDCNAELYIMYGVLVLYILIFSTLIGIALILKKKHNIPSLYIAVTLSLSATIVSTVYSCVYKNNLDFIGVVISLAVFLLSFAYVMPVPDELTTQICKRVFIAVPVFSLTLAVSTYETSLQLIIFGIINIAIIAFIANAQFHNHVYQHQPDTKLVKTNIQYGSVFVAALMAIMFIIKHNEYSDLFSYALTIIVEIVGTRVIKKYFNYVREYEKLQSYETLGLKNIKRHVYITFAALFLGAFVIIILSILQNTDNLLNSIFYFPKLSDKAIIYFLIIGVSSCIILIYAVGIKVPEKIKGNHIMILPIILSIVLYTSFMFFIFDYTNPGFLLESLNLFAIITYLSKLCMSLGIAFLLAEDFYSNAFLIYSKANRSMTLILSTIIGFYTLMCNCVILFSNKQQYAMNNENHYCIFSYLIISIFAFSVFPTLLAAVLKIIEEDDTSIVVVKYKISIFFDGFLYLLIFTFAGLIPDLINCLIDITLKKILLIISIFALLVWILSFCMKNNVAHYNERKNTAIQKYENKITEENKQIVRAKLTCLLRHLRIQNLMSIIALLVYSAIVVFALIVNEYWQQNDNGDKSFGEVFECLKQRYWPSN